MIVADVMDEIGSRLGVRLPDLNGTSFEADDVNVPCYMVRLPNEINYLGTYKNGMHSIVIEIFILVSLVDDKIRREQIAPYGDGRGTRSIKEILEGGTYSAFDVIAVSKATYAVIRISEVDYLGIAFMCNIHGSGR